ncbi:hypothetical protein CF326_g9088 [Tilletia indica]|nr:hypothetical protein CF326_g9088 [Tilletia indica]
MPTRRTRNSAARAASQAQLAHPPPAVAEPSQSSTVAADPSLHSASVSSDSLSLPPKSTSSLVPLPSSSSSSPPTAPTADPTGPADSPCEDDVARTDAGRDPSSMSSANSPESHPPPGPPLSSSPSAPEPESVVDEDGSAREVRDIGDRNQDHVVVEGENENDLRKDQQTNSQSQSNDASIPKETRRKNHRWDPHQEAQLVEALWEMEDLQARMLGRKETGKGRSEKGALTAGLNELGRKIHGANALAAQLYRHKITSMHKKYNIAKEQLSQTGQNKTGTEIVEGSALEKERVKATRECHYFEMWHEMALDRRSSAPPRVRKSGGAKMRSTSEGEKKATEDEEDGVDDEAEGESGGEEGEHNNEESNSGNNSRKRSASPDPSSNPPAESSSGSSNKRIRAPYRGADGFQELKAALQKSQEAAERRQEEVTQAILANQESERKRKEKEMELQEKQLKLEEKKEETQRMTVEALMKLAEKFN